jgi:hypothetical protein
MITPVTPTYQQKQSLFPQDRLKTSIDAFSSIETKGVQIEDTVSISKSAKACKADEKKAAPPDDENLDTDQKRQVDQLEKRDQEVKAHERAHMAAGGGLVQGGASYTYQRGVDGKLYAVGGEVKIDTSSERDPDQTIRKMQQVKRAALAPANPSGADRAVAARASQVELMARMEKAEQNETETENNLDGVQANKNSSDETGIQARNNLLENTETQSNDKSKDNKGFNPYQISPNQAHSLGHQINLSA